MRESSIHESDQPSFGILARTEVSFHEACQITDINLKRAILCTNLV